MVLWALFVFYLSVTRPRNNKRPQKPKQTYSIKIEFSQGNRWHHPVHNLLSLSFLAAYQANIMKRSEAQKNAEAL